MNWLWYLLFNILQLATAQFFSNKGQLGGREIKDPEWFKLLMSMICQRKEDSPTYHQDACLSGNPEFKWGHLGMEPDLLQIERNTDHLPLTGLWVSVMQFGFDGNATKTQGPGPQRRTNARIGQIENPRCLTWQSYKSDSDTLLRVTEDMGETFKSDSPSVWLGGVTFEECILPKDDPTSFDFEFSTLTQNQQWLVIKEDDQNGKDESSVAIRRILPNIPDIDNIWNLCNGGWPIKLQLAGVALGKSGLS
ncbi:hypothetical protein TWF281_010973 [Arthrobotrys megalospora]